MFILFQQSYCSNSHDFHWGCRSASLIEGALPCDLPTVGVMGVRKQSMNRRCLQLARWRLEYNPLWGEGVLAGPLHSALMWAPSNSDDYHHGMENAQKWQKQAIFHWKCLYFHQYLVKTAHSYKLWFDIYHFIQIEQQTTLQENFVYEK